MELLILNTNLESISILDYLESIIWTDRYNKCGDFEIVTFANQDIMDILKENYYLWIADSEHVMIIESRKTKSDSENGNKLVVTGRSLESILDRRITWETTELKGNLQDSIKKLLDENIINPSIAERKIDNFVFEKKRRP